MFEGINNCLEKVAYYTILMAAVQKILPGKKYRQYVKYYTALILISLIFSLIIREETYGRTDQGAYISPELFGDIDEKIMSKENDHEIRFDKITIGED